MDLKEEDILGEKIDAHWYYVSKGRAMRKMLDGIQVEEVIDVGAGSGIFSKQLLNEGHSKSAICVDPGYEVELEKAYKNKPLSFVKSIDKGNLELILMMDVLEHVPDDVALLKEYVGNLQAGGHVFITVPAFQFMWSGHDVFLEHYRRYTIPMLETALREAGMTPVKSRYFFASLFPAVFAIRMAKKISQKRSNLEPRSELKVYPAWLNNLLILIHDFERSTLFTINKMFGLSVCCLCRKD